MSPTTRKQLDDALAYVDEISQAAEESYRDTTLTAIKVDEVQAKLQQVESTVSSTEEAMKANQQGMVRLQENTHLLQKEQAHYEDYKKYGCCASVKSSLRNCTMYCCGEMISTISGAVTGGFVFQTTLAAVLGGFGGAVIGCGCLYGCYRIKKLCVH